MRDAAALTLIAALAGGGLPGAVVAMGPGTEAGTKAAIALAPAVIPANPPDPGGALVITAIDPTAGVTADGGTVQSAANAQAGGMRPSVIVGDLATLLAPAQSGPYGIPRQNRDLIRLADPGLFADLLGRGRFDPPEQRLAAALQAELAEMGCYDSGIDGNWGGGSQAALGRYRAASGAAGDAAGGGDQPSIGLFRVIAGAPLIRCPDAPRPTVVRATPAASEPAATQRREPRSPAATAGARRQPAAGNRAAAVSRAPDGGQSRGAARAPAAAGAPQTPAAGRARQPRIDPNLVGSGVFR